VEARDIVARPVTALDDAEVYGERMRARLLEGDLDGAERALAMLDSKVRAGEGILAARRARLG
jgi:hypothetical protein